MLTEFIDTVTVEKDNIFLWGLWLRNKPTYFRMTTEGRGKKMTARCEEEETSPKSNAPPPKWGKNGRLLFAGCMRDRLILKTRGTDSFFKSLNAEDSTKCHYKYQRACPLSG